VHLARQPDAARRPASGRGGSASITASAAAIQSAGACSDQPECGRLTVSGADASATTRCVVDQDALEPRRPEVEPEVHQAALFGFLAEDDHAEDVVLGHVVDVHGADELAVLHHARPVAHLHHLVDVVVDQEDAEALALQLLDQLGDHLRLLRAERRGRLVHDQDPSR
jgi:hypothetical protein